MRRLAAVAAALALLAVGPAAAQDAPQTDWTKHGNGLRVCVRPIPGAKQVAVLTLFDVGGDHDPEGRSGLAHLVEHLYTTCAAGETKARTAESFMAAYPNAWNAQTGDRYTVYATVVAPERLDAEVADHAARMGDLRIEQADLDRERPRVVAEVGNMFDGFPPLAAQNHARELVRWTPGGRRGGLPGQLADVTLDEVRDRCKRLYKPANARFVLAGAVERDAGRALVEAHFARVPPGERVGAPGIVHAGGTSRKVRIKSMELDTPDGVATSAACAAYPAPPLGDADLPAFLVLTTRLLMRSARPAKPAGGYQIQYAPIDDGATLSFVAQLGDEDGADALPSRVDEALAGVSDPAPSQFDRMQTRMTFGVPLGIGPPAFAAMNVYGAAFSAARLDQEGLDPVAFGKAIDAVTGDDLTRVAAKWFATERRVVVTVRPKSGK